MEVKPYDALLSLTESAAADAPPRDSPEEAEALERFRAYFADLSPERARETTHLVYAEDAWLHDTVAQHHGIKAIKKYFLQTAERADGVKVEILDFMRKENEIYTRWTMDITWSAFKKGQTTRSAGMSHLRLNSQGKVCLHYDFWDNTSGLFEHLPLIGATLRWMKRRMA